MSLASKRLADAHRRAQAKIAADIVDQMRAIWPLLDSADLDGSFQRWLTASIPLVEAGRTTSSKLASTYLTAHKALMLGPENPSPVILADPVDRAVLATNLMVTGPVSVKRAMLRAAPLDDAMDTAEGSSAAAAMRQVLNGGRDTILATIFADPQAKGWERVTGGKCCDFCEMLAGRGAVYSADTVDFQAHDGCSCSAEPVYS